MSISISRSDPTDAHPFAERVLIVDDEPDFRHVARMLLATRGYDIVAEACCAESALDAVARHQPQAVLLDVRLGHDDGFEVCELLTRFRPGLAVLLVSATEPDQPERVTRCGARGFVPKYRLRGTDFKEFFGV